MKLLVGSNNKHKIEEIENIFKRNNFEIDLLCPKNFNIDEEPIEDGISFKENSEIKARFFYEKTHMPCIGEDSGITIEYFNNFPGIYSKRFLQYLDNESKNNYILKVMENVKNRKATFHTFITYIDENGASHYFEGINEGEIALQQKGNEGFGYDPIFLIPKYGKTEAELGNEFKNQTSHRAKAISKLIEYLKENEK